MLDGDFDNNFLKEKINQLEFELGFLSYEKEKLEQKVIVLENNKEIWFTKYHEERQKRYDIQKELAELHAEYQDLSECRFSKHQELVDYKEQCERLKVENNTLNKIIENYDAEYEEYSKFFWGGEDR